MDISGIVQASNIEKSFLFDVASKIYIATDSSPVEIATYELCCDVVDVALDISAIYGYFIVTFLSNSLPDLVLLFFFMKITSLLKLFFELNQFVVL